MKPGIVSDDVLRQMATKFRMLGEPTRLAILRALMMQGEMNVGRLVDDTGQSQANVSKHLKLLAQAKLVSRRKEGLQVYYRLSDPIVEKICHLVCDSILDDLAGNLKPGR